MLGKNKGGLGIQNLEVFNIALMSKWRWRLLNDEEFMWRKILISRYGDVNFSQISQ